MWSEAEENYLKETYALQLDHDQVTTSMLAQRIGHSAPTVTGMLKRLSGRKWVTYEPYRGVTLTKSGKAAALDVIRRHRLLETFLTRVLDIPWDRVHAEAERLEHALSDYLEGRIDEYLGHPERDPHGSPIPAADGSIDEPDRLHLSDLPRVHRRGSSRWATASPVCSPASMKCIWDWKRGSWSSRWSPRTGFSPYAWPGISAFWERA